MGTANGEDRQNLECEVKFCLNRSTKTRPTTISPTSARHFVPTTTLRLRATANRARPTIGNCSQASSPVTPATHHKNCLTHKKPPTHLSRKTQRTDSSSFFSLISPALKKTKKNTNKH